MLTLFYRYYRPLIDAGHLYIALPPLYKVKKGKEIAYAYTDEEKDQIVAGMGGMTEDVATKTDADGEELEGEVVDEDGEAEVKKRNTKIQIQRYKGLGEMNADELWETTMEPDTRVLKQVTIHDAEDADGVFDVLMGSEVEPRRLFIQTHAKLANIDI